MKLKNILFLLFILYSPGILIAQVNEFHLRGEVAELESKYKYVTFYIAGREDLPKSIFSAPIINKAFDLKITLDKKGYSIVAGNLFFTELDTLTTENYLEYLKKKSRNYRSLVVEDLEIRISSTSSVKDSKVLGSSLNRDWDDAFKAIQRRQAEQFVLSHSHSPVCVYLISSMKQFTTLQDQQYMFNSLADYTKQTKEGRNLMLQLFATGKKK